ncbi:MAG: hypothetical protein H0T21_04655 [Gemmatimonadaceae bacterium]|nr:hypothetical protein [Gemmatimonadaceae bacterium]
MPARRLNTREKRVILVASAIAALALSVAFVLSPFYRKWNLQEAQINASSDRLFRLRRLIEDQDALYRTLSGMERSSGVNGRLVSARTVSLASSELQRVMQMYAEQSKVSIDRLEFSAAADSAGDASSGIPLTISAVGDIYGITGFLSALRSGTPVVEVRELTLVSNSALRDGLIQFSASLLAPVVIE